MVPNYLQPLGINGAFMNTSQRSPDVRAEEVHFKQYQCQQCYVICENSVDLKWESITSQV